MPVFAKCFVCEHLCISPLFIMSYLRTLVYYYVVHYVVSANTCVLVRCSLCRVCEHLCITTLFSMSCLRTLVYYYVVHYVVSAKSCVLLRCSLCRVCEHLYITTLFIALYCCRDTEVVICIILAIRKRADGLIYYSSIKHYRRTSETMIGKQWSTLNQNTIANTIYCQGFDISGKTFWKTRFDDSLKILKFLTY